jgi:uncharacterized protein YecE (DUF72 family)
MSGCVHIGTSGWHYKHWLGPFYPAAERPERMLSYYFQQFDTVEINNSFYRLPTPAALGSWREQTPADFRFAVKGSRFITHMKKLKDPAAALANFLPRVEILGEKLGPIVFQLPPRWQSNPGRLEAFLHELPQKHDYAFELRNATWHNDTVYELLRRHNAAFCIYELAGFHSPFEVTADFTYVRLHGPDGPYQGSYSTERLTAWARQIWRWQRALTAIYVYFDNDQSGYAAHNALELKRLVEARERKTRSR